MNRSRFQPIGTNSDATPCQLCRCLSRAQTCDARGICFRMKSRDNPLPDGVIRLPITAPRYVLRASISLSACSIQDGQFGPREIYNAISAMRILLLKVFRIPFSPVAFTPSSLLCSGFPSWHHYQPRRWNRSPSFGRSTASAPWLSFCGSSAGGGWSVSKTSSLMTSL